MEWFYANEGQRVGPVPTEELLRRAQTGAVHADTLVWRRGMTSWRRFEDCSTELAVPPSLPDAGAERVAPASSASNVQPAAPRVGQLIYGDFWVRAAAKVIDQTFVTILGLFLFSVVAGMIWKDHLPDVTDLDEMKKVINVYMLVVIAVDFVYTVFFVRRFRGTPGKLMLGLRLVSAAGTPLSTGVIIRRYFAEMLSRLALFFGYAVAAGDAEGRTLHDRLCDTRVISLR